MILFYLPLLLFLYLITLTIWSWTSIIPTCSNSLSLSPSLLDNLETLPDSRVRLSKLIGKSRLGPISMWVAFPSSEEIVPGAAWYDQLWNKNKFGGYEYIDDIISVSPCENYDKIFIQIGAHLGIFPLVAAYRGCRAIAVEPMPAAINFTRISAKLNNWGEDKFIAINAVGSNKSGGFMLFDTRTMSVSENSANMKRKLPIPMITLDALNDNYGSTQGRSESSIKFVIVDVEGHEQEVLLGGKKLIEQRSVLVFEIEVWSVQPKTGLVRSFPGLELLVDNGYRLYTRTSNLNMGFKPCDELTNRLSEIPRIFNRTCQMPDYPKSRCLNEVFAIRNDVLPFHTWYSSCSRRTNN
jgi:FkbM family methyltransferase